MAHRPPSGTNPDHHSCSLLPLALPHLSVLVHNPMQLLTSYLLWKEMRTEGPPTPDSGAALGWDVQKRVLLCRLVFYADLVCPVQPFVPLPEGCCYPEKALELRALLSQRLPVHEAQTLPPTQPCLLFPVFRPGPGLLILSLAAAHWPLTHPLAAPTKSGAGSLRKLPSLLSCTPSPGLRPSPWWQAAAWPPQCPGLSLLQSSLHLQPSGFSKVLVTL